MSSLFDSNMRKYGQWKKDQECCKYNDKKKIKKIIWRSGLLTNDLITALSEGLRHKINEFFGFTGNQVIPDGLTHDFVEVHIECENEECQKKFKTIGDSENKKKPLNCYCCTFEYGSMGTKKEEGMYENWVEDIKYFVPKNIGYNYLLFIFGKF